MEQFRQVLPAVSPTTGLPAADAAPTGQESVSRALDLITEVGILLPALYAQCDQLDETIVAMKEKAKVDLAAVASTALQWQQIAFALKEQASELIGETTACQLRAEAADAEAAAIETSGQKIQRAAQEADTLNALFRDKIMSSFGAGSPGRTAIERLRAVSPAA